MMEIIKTVNRLPNSLCSPFIEWCTRGGHEIQIKKGKVSLKKGKNVGVIKFDGKIEDDYQMNDYLTERFQLFSKQWLNNGESFVEELSSSMLCKFNQIQNQISLSELRMVA